MGIKTFAAIIKRKIEEKMGADVKISIKEVNKNNGTVLTALFFTTKSSYSSLIYMNEYFEKYSTGKMTIEEIIDSVIDIYNNNHHSLSFQDTKNNIIFKLINTEKNAQLLETIPNIPLEDLSIVFQVFISDESDIQITIPITNEHINAWQVDAKTIYDYAKINTQNILGYQLTDICTTLQTLSSDFECPSGQIPMYILTNSNSINGAGCILYEDLLCDFAQLMGSDLYILPSSVHEVILMPVDKAPEVDLLRDTIKEVNSTQVAPEDFLSDSLYCYKRNSNAITKF